MHTCLATAMSNVQSSCTTQCLCCTSSTRALHFSCTSGATNSRRVRSFTPFPQDALHGLQSLQSVTGHIGSAISRSASPPTHAGCMHFSRSITDTCGHFLRPSLSKNLLVRTEVPTPHVTEHSDHGAQGVVVQIPSFSSNGCSLLLSAAPPRHSGTAATHISLDTSCRSQPSICAFASFKYVRCRIRSPFPHVTEHRLHSEYSVTPHSGLEVSSVFSATCTASSRILSRL